MSYELVYTSIHSSNNVVVTVLYLLRVLHRRIIVYRILYKNQRIRASLDTAIYEKKTVRLFIILVAAVDRALITKTVVDIFLVITTCGEGDSSVDTKYSHMSSIDTYLSTCINKVNMPDILMPHFL